MIEQVYGIDYTVSAAECDAEERLPLKLLAQRMLEVATVHANTWGVGHISLSENGQLWVLSRMAIEMYRYPTPTEPYRIETWIEDYNKHFSERNYSVIDSKGETIGYARSIWVVIDKDTRESVDISKFEYLRDKVSNRVCPIAKMSKLRPFEAATENKYIFKYSDIDFNRHVNSIKYIEHYLDQMPIDIYEHNYIQRFEIVYSNEAKYGEEATIKSLLKDNVYDGEMRVNEKIICRTRIIFENRNNNI